MNFAAALQESLYLGRGLMRSWPLPLQPRFFVFTAVVLATATLTVTFFFSPSIYIAIPLAICAALSIVGTVDLIQTRHAVLRNYPLTPIFGLSSKKSARRSVSISWK